MSIGEEEENEADGRPELPPLPGFGDLDGSSTKESVKPSFSQDDPQAAPAVAGGNAASPSGEEIEPGELSDAYRGRTFGGFALLQKIGEGGMGVVYKARQLSLDRVVAIKILSKSLSANAEFIKRFEREAKSIAKITHPNIVAVYDFGRADGSFYMVTEFVEGSNLAKIIHEKQVMKAEEIVPIIVHALAGLGHVAGQGIVHRDIKPDNILVTKDGVAKIADFGLAKDISNDTDLTVTGLAMGTPAYMSPEQCMGRKLDVRSDLYALGITAYFAITGEKPFTGESSFEIMTKQREHNPKPPAQLNPHLGMEISALVMRMMAKTPQERFADANECREAWIQAGERLNAVAHPPRSGEQPSSPQEAAKLYDGLLPPVPTSASGSANPPSFQLEPLAPASPPATLPASLPSSLPPPLALPPEPPPVAEMPRSITDRQPALKVPTDRQSPAKVSTDRQSSRVSTDRRPITVKPGSPGEAVTCPRCGFLNRSELRNCQRCSHALQPETEIDVKAHEDEAQRLFARGEFLAAAERYARLADKTDDRRLRTVLRSKESEARKLEEEQKAQTIGSRSNSLITRGDLKGGLEILERGLRDVQSASSSSGRADSQLLVQINDLRSRIRHRRQAKIVALVVLVLGGLIAAGWWAVHSGFVDRFFHGETKAPDSGAP